LPRRGHLRIAPGRSPGKGTQCDPKPRRGDRFLRKYSSPHQPEGAVAFNPLNPTGGSSGLQATESTHTLRSALAAGSSLHPIAHFGRACQLRFDLPITSACSNHHQWNSAPKSPILPAQNDPLSKIEPADLLIANSRTAGADSPKCDPSPHRSQRPPKPPNPGHCGVRRDRSFFYV